jgi:uncharacterized protein YndB with AHSA1/START domain
MKITVRTNIEAPLEMVWKCFTTPEDIVNWNTASPDWHTVKAENDLQIGGKFNYRMEAKDGSFGFDFWGTYAEIIPNERLTSTLGDGRSMEVLFLSNGNTTEVIETFETENENPVELQLGGWQSILDNLKKYIDQIK